MKMSIRDFFKGPVGQITEFLFEKGWNIQQILEEVRNPNSYQIQCMGMYHCPIGRELQNFINHSRWSQKIKRDAKFLDENRLMIEKSLKELPVNKKRLGE